MRFILNVNEPYKCVVPTSSVYTSCFQNQRFPFRHQTIRSFPLPWSHAAKVLFPMVLRSVPFPDCFHPVAIGLAWRAHKNVPFQLNTNGIPSMKIDWALWFCIDNQMLSSSTAKKAKPPLRKVRHTWRHMWRQKRITNAHFSLFGGSERNVGIKATLNVLLVWIHSFFHLPRIYLGTIHNRHGHRYRMNAESAIM